MNRRNFLTASALTATAVAALVRPARLLAAEPAAQPLPIEGKVFYVDAVGGAEHGRGDRRAPLRTLGEAMRRVNRDRGKSPITIVLDEGIHVIDETVRVAPRASRLSRESRLTIRAAILPGEPTWHLGRMPTLIHTMPLKSRWNGRDDVLGGAADGLLIETSHVTVRGLRILGMPIVETPLPGTIRRLYSISRLDKTLDDLEIAQCLFLGDDLIAPSHVAIIALGNGLTVDHCVFRGLKIAAVYWGAGSSGHAMRHCVCDSLYGSSVWTAGIAEDFDYSNNLVVNCNYVWTNQSAASASADAGARVAAPAANQQHYRVRDCYLSGNRRLTGSGTGARLEYRDIDPAFLVMERTTIVDIPVSLPRDATSRDYLRAPNGTAAARPGAGLYLVSAA